MRADFIMPEASFIRVLLCSVTILWRIRDQMNEGVQVGRCISTIHNFLLIFHFLFSFTFAWEHCIIYASSSNESWECCQSLSFQWLNDSWPLQLSLCHSHLFAWDTLARFFCNFIFFYESATLSIVSIAPLSFRCLFLSTNQIHTKVSLLKVEAILRCYTLWRQCFCSQCTMHFSCSLQRKFWLCSWVLQ